MRDGHTRTHDHPPEARVTDYKYDARIKFVLLLSMTLLKSNLCAKYIVEYVFKKILILMEYVCFIIFYFGEMYVSYLQSVIR